MTEVSLRGFPPGAPWWLDLASPGTPAAQEFLTGLFGWEPVDAAESGVAGYTVQILPGTEFPSVAGLMPTEDSTMAPLWTCFFRVPNLRTSADTVRLVGGTVLMEITPIGDFGRMILALDPQGAGFGLWDITPTTSVINTGIPHTLHLIELRCPDPEKAERFYTTVLGASPHPAVPGEQNIGWQIAPTPETPARWTPYFTVTDLNASLARARSLNGEIKPPPSPGRTAIVSGPATAPFGLIEH
jgi:predicted enzyme related to lactoylglutathione lyase